MSEIQERLSLFTGLYDQLRIVDPHRKIIINEDGAMNEFNKAVVVDNCFDFWRQNGVCKNCVSYRAYYEGQSVTKIERCGEDFYWTVAVPIHYESELYIVEFLKKVTQGDSLIDSIYKTSMPLDSTVFKLNDLAHTDSLTKVYNRRYIDSKLKQELEYSQFYQEELSILLIDIDYFKQVNDQYGHLIGDKVLAEFAESVMKMLRQEVDWIGRYGGEEFIVVLNRTSLNAARLVAERIRYRIEGEVFKIDGLEIELTCSIGIASNVLLSCDERQLIEKADQNLYRAKVNG